MALGKLEKVDIRQQWENEARDFTPWLAENLDLLAEQIGSGELEKENTEFSIGAFSADIVAQTLDGKKVVIENQLDRTDHDHLGKLMTYASGVEANTVVWICGEAREEHRRAIDWLNELGSDVAFFLCQVELWKIGESQPAPRLEIICRPNEWARATRGGLDGDQFSGKNAPLLLDFWTEFRDYARSRNFPLNLRNPIPRRFYQISIGKTGFSIELSIALKKKQAKCSLYIKGGAAVHKQLWQLLEESANKIGEMKTSIATKYYRIFQSVSVDPSDRSKWPEAHKWLLDKTEQFSSVFGPVIKDIDIDELMGKLEDEDEMG